jgi:hypothetical protein
MFFLFSDVLIYSKRKRLNKEKYTVRGLVPMDVVLIRDLERVVRSPTDSKDEEKKQEKLSRSFQLVRMDTKKLYTIRAKTRAEKVEWMKDLEQIINHYLSKLQKLQKIPQNLDEVVDVTVTFLLWGVLPSKSGAAQRKAISRNSAFIQRRPQNFFLPKDQDLKGNEGKCIELNTIYVWTRETVGEASNVVEQLLKQILEIYNDYSFLFAEFGERATSCIFLDPRYEHFVKGTGELTKIDLHSLSNTVERRTFFVNLYHLLLLHAHVEFGPPTSVSSRLQFAEMVTYVLANVQLSLADIEYRILRAHMSQPDLFGNKFSKIRGKKRNQAEIEQLALDSEPLLNFALSYLTASSPVPQVYHLTDLERELRKAAQAYLVRHLLIDNETGRICLPKLVEWFGRDLGSGSVSRPNGPVNNQELLWSITNLLSPPESPLAKTLSSQLQQLTYTHDASSLSVCFNEYDWGFAFTPALVQTLPPQPEADASQLSVGQLVPLPQLPPPPSTAFHDQENWPPRPLPPPLAFERIG